MVFFQVLFVVLAIALILWMAFTILAAVFYRATSSRTPVPARAPVQVRAPIPAPMPPEPPRVE